MTRYLSKSEEKEWQELADLWRVATSAVEEIQLKLMLDMGITHGPAMNAVSAARDCLAGNAYMFTPQPEWTGGDSMLDENYKIRAPHIMGKS